MHGPMEWKTRSLSVCEGIKSAVGDFAKYYPKKLITWTTDEGNEFRGLVSKFLDDNNIKHYTMVSSESNKSYSTAHVESFNKTLLNYIKRVMLINKLNWSDHLDDIITNYNSTIHSRTQQTPKDIFLGKEKSLEKPHETIDDGFNLGDYVRHRLDTTAFAKKGRIQSYSDIIYRIYDRVGYRYRLKGAHGVLKTAYLPRDLLLVPKESIDITLDTELMTTNKRRVKKKQLQRRSDIGKVNEEGEVEIHRRQLPTNEKRKRKAPTRIDL